MDKHTQHAWERFLNPATLRSNLIVASIFLTSFELLKQSIVERVQDFYSVGFDIAGPRIDPKYGTEVLAKNKSRVYASLAWLKESDAIDDTDISNFDKVRETRNEIAHEITRILTN